MDLYVDASLDHQHAIGLSQFQLHLCRFGKDDSFEGLDRGIIGHQHHLPAPGQKPADIHLVRLVHKSNSPQHEAPPTGQGRHGLLPF